MSDSQRSAKSLVSCDFCEEIVYPGMKYARVGSMLACKRCADEGVVEKQAADLSSYEAAAAAYTAGLAGRGEGAGACQGRRNSSSHL